MRVDSGNRHLEINYLDEDILNSFSDVQIISSEGEIVFTNRLALSCCSNFLEKLFVDIESSGCLASENELVISTDISIESLNAILDFVTQGTLPVSQDSNKNETNIDPEVVKDLMTFGIDLSNLEMEVVTGSNKNQRQVVKRKEEQLVNDQTRFVRLDWDILGAALESIGGLDPQQGTSVEVVSFEGDTQQIIIQPDGSASFLAQLSDAPSNVDIVIGPDVPPPDATPKRKSSDYNACSAKMRRILKTSKMFPHKRKFDMEASASASKSRGRPRKDLDSDDKKSSAKTNELKLEDEKENAEKKEVVFERPGRRPVKRPKRFEEMTTVDVKLEESDQVLDVDAILLNEDQSSSGDESKEKFSINKKVGVKRVRASGSSKTPVKWMTCIACGKICKSNYLFKIHQKNFGPFHDNTCALCSEEFTTWENHIAHLREKHNGEYKYKCGLCPEIFETEERQRIHRHEMHTRKNKDKTACDKCGKVVIDYTAHQENYHGNEEHLCPNCPRVFGHTMALKRHIKDNHRQFPCEHCGNIMKNFKKYRLHILSVHTPDNLKPYQCHICVPSKGFATKWNLFEHMNKHTNERPFKCRACPAAFATTSSRCHHEKACAGNKGNKVK